MSAENLKISDNRSSGEYLTLKKSTVKTFIVIVAAVVIGGLGAWFVNSFGFLSFSVSSRGALAVLDFIITYGLYAASAVAAVLAVSAILFRFVRFSYKVFVPVSAAASLLIGARVVYDYFTSMIASEYLPDFVDINSIEAVILWFCFVGLAVAVCVFLLSLPFGRVIRKLAVR